MFICRPSLEKLKSRKLPLGNILIKYAINKWEFEVYAQAYNGFQLRVYNSQIYSFGFSSFSV